MMSYKYIEKAFLYLLALSVLLHAAALAVIVLLPQEKKVVKQEPVMVELQDLPPSKPPETKGEKEAKRLAEERRRVAKETAPKGEMERERIASLPRTLPRQAPPRPAQPQRGGERGIPRQIEEGAPVQEAPRREDIFRPKEQGVPDISKLFPSAGKMAKLEDSYRKKYGPEVEEGETKFLNTEDIQFGSFLRRFETAVYGVWRYPTEAARLGIEGVTPVKITFNRKGEVEKVEILESSGSRILDDEVLRTLHALGPIGSFPKGYDRDTFNLIAFFQYGIIRGSSRGVLH
ncbi:MAG: periplasmic protein [Geobacteraceae bacterium]|nr:MAG: periplasmic protein [Geobacteraceae bacterium]